MTLSFASAANGQQSPGESAKAHYDKGVALSTDGALDLALAEFQQAYSLEPHPAALFNIGQLQFALGQPVEAKLTLEQFLEQGRGLPSSDRVEQSRRTIELCRRRIGTLEIRAEPSDAEIIVDGRGVAKGIRSLPVTTGPHGVVVARARYATQFLSPKVTAGEIEQVTVRLSTEVDSVGWLDIECEVPGVSVVVEGEPRLTGIPQTPIPLAPGPRTVRFERRGYRSSLASVAVQSGKVQPLACALTPLSTLGPRDAGELVLSGVAPGARVEIDGAPRTGTLVPVGPHRVAVFAEGFVPWSREVTVVPRTRQIVQVNLDPTPEARSLRVADWERKRTLGYATGGAALALGAAAVVTYALNSDRHDRWLAKRDELEPAQDWSERWGDLSEESARIQRVDDLALGLAVTGGILLATSAYYFLTAEKPPESSAGSALRAVRHHATASWEW